MIIKNECNAICRVPKNIAFEEFSHIPEYYTELSPGHLQYKINGNLAIGSEISVTEKAGFQHVQHAYQVTELIKNSKVSLVSPHSKVRIFGIIPSKSSSNVEFLFSDEANDTKIHLTICIKFNSRIRYLFAIIFMTKLIWALHAKHELKTLARIIEQRATFIEPKRV